MSEINLTIPGGTSRRLLTKGKLCDKNIVVTAEGGDDRYDEGYDNGRTDGAQAEYDAFWDAFQGNGSRNHYVYAFAYNWWTDSIYNPKYPIIPTSADGMVCMFYANPNITDTKVPITAHGSCSQAFGWASKLKRIPKLIFDSPTDVSRMFNGCTSLEEICCEGEINLSISFADASLLSADSVQSIIDCLKDLSGQTAQTLTLHATIGVNLTDEQKAAITAKNWTLVY